MGLALVAGLAWWWTQPQPGPSGARPTSATTAAPAPSASLVPLTLHFADAQGRFLVPKVAKLPWGGTQASLAQVTALVQALQRAPQGLLPAVPPGVQVRQASYQAPHWVLTLEAPLGLGGTGESLLLGALVRSLVGATPQAEGLKLSLLRPDGQPNTGLQWDLGAPLRPGDFDNQAGAPTAPGVEAKLWWPTKGGSALVPTKLALTPTPGAVAKELFEAWIAGPPGGAKAFLEAGFPPEVQAKWMGLDPAGVATVALAGERPPSPELLARGVRALVLTLTEQVEVKALRIQHPGAPWPDALPGLAWAEALTRAQAQAGVEAQP